MAMMLQGDKPIRGLPGKSTYQNAVENGYIGTEAEFYATLGGIGDLITELQETKSLSDGV